jgi:hypothetical protein
MFAGSPPPANVRMVYGWPNAQHETTRVRIAEKNERTANPPYVTVIDNTTFDSFFHDKNADRAQKPAAACSSGPTRDRTEAAGNRCLRRRE